MKIAKNKTEIFFTILILLFVIYLIIGVVKRQLNESYLDKKHIFIAVSISNTRYGRVSSADFYFTYKNKKYLERETCASSELNKMKKGDIYLARFSEQIEFSELLCDCKLSKSDKGKVWDTFPGCNN